MRRVWLLCLIIGCGDPLVEEGYRGEPLISLNGVVNDFRYFPETGNLKASIFWSLSGKTSTHASDLAEQPNISVAVAFPAVFQINVFQPPRGEGVENLTPYKVGQILVYDDIDNNGRMSAEELRGGAIDTALLYTESALEKESSPTGSAMPSGYSIARLPLPCEELPTIPDTTVLDSCGVRLGQSCLRDEDCGGNGICITAFSGGYCVVPYEEQGCWPVNGTLGSTYFVQTASITQYAWYLACDDQNDCRVSDGYECASWLIGCFPEQPIFLDIYPDFWIIPLCYQDLSYDN